MKKLLSVLASGVILLSACAPKEEAIIAWTEQESNLLEGAAERIENYRKGDATVLVTDADGRPVNRAVVRMEMVKHDFLFGSSLFNAIPWGAFNEAYQDAFVNLFNYATVPAHWADYEPSQDQEQVEKLMDWARWASEHGIITKGHALIFPTLVPVPSWARQFSPEQLDEALHKRVTSIVERFRGLIYHWDVMNEPTYVPNFWEPLDGWMLAYTPVGATARALEWAHASNPEATLLINDWKADWEFHALLEDVIEAGAQFDAIGIQSHMHTGTWSLTRVWDTCERFKDFNVPLYFTEVTVLSGDSFLKPSQGWSTFREGRETTPEGEAMQAEYAAALYAILFSHPSVQSITWWDLSDYGAWQGAPAGLLYKDSSPKPAYECLMELIHQEWWTNANSKTNELGEATVRGFYGQYLLTAELGEKSVQKLVHLSADRENVFEVQLP